MRFLFCLILWPFLAQAQTTSNCQPSNELFQFYEQDMKQMALNHLYATNHPDTGTIEIPAFWTQQVARGMMAILSSNLPQSDSIFNYYCVHHHRIGLNTSFTVALDTQYTWARNLFNGTFPTGNPFVDSLMQRHRLNVSFTYSFNPPTAVVSTAQDSTWNMRQLVHTFEGVSGVYYASEGGFIGDGSRIEYADTNGIQTYTFSRRWGDCPLGCTCWRTWKFQVNAQCQVTYLGATQYSPMPTCQFGNYIPECNAFNSTQRLPSITTHLGVYPNPSSGLVYVDAGDEAIEQLLVFGLDGRLLHQAQPHAKQVQLNLLHHWPEGVYLLQARIKDRLYHQKMVLQR